VAILEMHLPQERTSKEIAGVLKFTTLQKQRIS